MTSDGDWFEAMTESFPGRTPRVLLSSVYWSIVAFATLLAVFNTWAAFQMGSGSGMIALSISFVAMLVWLAVWRVMLEAAASLFDIRDSMGQLQGRLDTINRTLKSMDMAPLGGGDAPVDFRSPRTGSAVVSRAGRKRQTSMLASRVLRYLNKSDGASFEVISDALGVSHKEAVDALTQLQADALVVRRRGGVYRSSDREVGAVSGVAVPSEANDPTRAVLEAPEDSKQDVAGIPDAQKQADQATDAPPVAEEAPHDQDVQVAAGSEAAPVAGTHDCGACGASHDVGQRFCSRCGGEL